MNIFQRLFNYLKPKQEPVSIYLTAPAPSGSDLGDWPPEDYPITVLPNGGDVKNGYIARVENWPLMVGLGDTPEAARANVLANLAAYPNRPRPGVVMPIHFASSQRIDAFGSAAFEIVAAITGTRPFILTDGSSLFVFSDDITVYKDSVLKLYDVDISDLEDGNIAEILERIKVSRE